MTMVIKRTESRRNRKKAQAREQIIATAIDLFSRHGLEGVTVEHIADVADLGKGTIYNYFETKEDIVVAFMVEKERQIQAKVRRLAASKGAMFAVLTEYIRFQFQLKRPYHKFVRVFLAQMFSRTEQFGPYMIELQKAIDPNLKALFRSLQARGAMRNDVKISDLVLIFKTIHLGLSALWAVEGPPFRMTEQIVKQEMKLFCEGLEAGRR